MNLALLTDWLPCLRLDTFDSYISAVYLTLGLHAISQQMSDECKERELDQQRGLINDTRPASKQKKKKNAYYSFHSIFK